MKKIFGVLGISLILFGSIFISTAVGVNTQDNTDLELKLLIVFLGTVNVRNDEKQLYGFATVGYTDGETFTFQRYTIDFEGIPFFITKGLGITVCIYNPAS
jgi:hypothetical protein